MERLLHYEKKNPCMGNEIIHPRRVALKIFLCWPKKNHAKQMFIRKFPVLHNFF